MKDFLQEIFDYHLEQKILDLVGLDKRQFMQVAMIAQGEYMNFLQADSKQKKLIFRELFHTGLYEKIEISLKDTLNRETQDRERQIKDWEREVNRINRMIKIAGFQVIKTLEEFI